MLWADALDSHGNETRTGAGALGLLLPRRDIHPTLEDVREAFRDRLVSTPGVVATTDQSAAASITIELVSVPLPDSLNAHWKQLREKWETPDGHPFIEAAELWRHARELACGFYYRWNPRAPEPWLEARRAWCKAVREVLKHSRSLDSELQVTNAVDAGRLPALQSTLEAWRAVRDTFEPRTEAVWLDRGVLEAAAEWLENNRELCWVEHREFGAELSKLARVPYFAQGGRDAAGRSIEQHRGPAILSIAANSEGRNLQRYSRNLVVSLPPSGATWEQLVGRTHRAGQEADEVAFTVFVNCSEQLQGFERARADARYIEATTGQSQKLNVCDTVNCVRPSRSSAWG
jgi:hypothetical protein